MSRKAHEKAERMFCEASLDTNIVKKLHSLRHKMEINLSQVLQPELVGCDIRSKAYTISGVDHSQKAPPIRFRGTHHSLHDSFKVPRGAATSFKLGSETVVLRCPPGGRTVYIVVLRRRRPRKTSVPVTFPSHTPSISLFFMIIAYFKVPDG